MHLSLSLPLWLATLVAGGAITSGLGVGGALLARRDGSRLANTSMGALLVLASLSVLYMLLLVVQPPGENPSLLLAPLPYTLALGPLLYTYVRARLGRGAPSGIHAILPVAQALLLVGVAVASAEAQRWYLGRIFYPWWARVQIALVAASLAGYLAASVRTLRRSGARFGWAERRDRWLRLLLLGVGASVVALVTSELVVPWLLGPPGSYGPTAIVSTTVYTAVLALAVFGGLVQVGVWTGAVTEAPPDASAPRMTLHPSLASTHAEALAQLVQTEQPHLDPDLTLGSLAMQIGTTDKVLSAVLNEHVGTGYADYVNGLRVAEAQRRLAAPEHAHLSVLAVGLDAGFASKSTFNRVFKERTGETPSAYRASAQVPRGV